MNFELQDNDKSRHPPHAKMPTHLSKTRKQYVFLPSPIVDLGFLIALLEIMVSSAAQAQLLIALHRGGLATCDRAEFILCK
jgi:hypothetical protein